MSRYSWTLNPTSRVRFTGKVRMKSALHVGSGRNAKLSDAGVTRHLDGRPFIPGSSLKGVLRTHLERLAQVLPEKVKSCMLYNPSLESVCGTPDWVSNQKDVTDAKQEDFENLCHTCTLFGSPILAGKIRIPDLEVEETLYSIQTELRDGVGIDRDRGVAVDQVKYDFEVVPSDTVFFFQLDMDSPDDVELGLIAAGIREMERGYLSVGGKTTRGLGSFELQDVNVFMTEFGPDHLDQLKAYLKKSTPVPMSKVEADKFLGEKIDFLFN